MKKEFGTLQNRYRACAFRNLTVLLMLAGCGKNSESTSQSLIPLGIPGQTCPAQTLDRQQDSNGESSIVLDSQYEQYIVKIKKSGKELEPSGNSVREYRVSGLTFTKFAKDTYTTKLIGTYDDKAKAVEKLQKDADVLYVEPDYTVRIENTSLADRQWAHKAVDSQGAWSFTTGEDDIVVAVIDSGIDYTHSDLQNNIWRNSDEQINGIDDDGNGYIDDVRGWNFAQNNADPMTTSQSNHGTHVAGIIGASGNVLGESQKVKLMPLKFITETGNGITSNAIRAIDYAIRKRVFAINNSWGSESKSKALGEAITRAERAGILFVVAAGNGESGKGFDLATRPWYPAAYENSNILRVAATTPKDELTQFSNFGATSVDVAAPGFEILSTVTGNKYEKMSGTSMAAPLVTGLAVLVKAANPNLDMSMIKKIISASSDQVSALANKTRSRGRVNAKRAVLLAIGQNGEFVRPNPNTKECGN